MIGLYKAVRDFKADKLSSFRAFAELCITRQIITAIITSEAAREMRLQVGETAAALIKSTEVMVLRV